MKWKCPDCGCENRKEMTIFPCGYIDDSETNSNNINRELVALVLPLIIILFSLTLIVGTALSYSLLMFAPIWCCVFLFYSISGLRNGINKRVALVGIISNGLIIILSSVIPYLILLTSKM